MTAARNVFYALLTPPPTVVPRPLDWCLGRTNPKKVVHHARCPHARTEYVWARQYPTIEALADALVAADAQRWHHFCQSCAGDLEDAVWAALLRRSRVAHP